MRALLAVILLVLIGAVGTTYWFGVQVEKNYESAWDEIEETRWAEVVSQRFDRGVFNSKAETTLELGSEGSGLRLVSRDSIVHGPFALGNLARGEYELSLTRALIENEVSLEGFAGVRGSSRLLDVLPPLRLDSELLISGDYEARFASEPVSRRFEPGGGGLDFRGVSGQVLLNPDAEKGRGSLAMPFLELGGTDFNVKVRGVSSSFDYVGLIPGLNSPIGSAEASIEEFYASSGEESLRLSGLSVSARTQEKGGNVDHYQNYSVEEVALGDVVYGPGSMALSLTNINVGAVKKIREAVYKIDGSGLNEELRSELLLFKTMELLPALLSSSPQFEISQFSFRTQRGEISGSSKISIGRSMGPGTQPGAQGSLFALASAISAELRFSIPAADLIALMKAAAKRDIIREREGAGQSPLDEEGLEVMAVGEVTERIEQLLAMGFLRKRDEYYTTEASYSSGVLTVNGNPMPIPGIPLQ